METVLAVDSQLVNFDEIIYHKSAKGEQLKKKLNNKIKTTKRPECETNFNLKQLICYGFITYKDEVFIVKRLNKQSEQRLHNLYSIGIGGHANPIEIPIPIIDILQQNMVRELHEETYIQDYNINLYGFLNDNSNDVGKVHLGIVYKIEALNPLFTIKEIDKMTRKFIPINELHKYYNEMETWSQILSKNLQIKEIENENI